jgi:tryptophan synthase alpha chain
LTAERLDTRFATLAREERAGFIAYVMAGDPDRATASAILAGLPGAGADIIELGLPFSDPVADGPTIQRAAIRALDGGMTLNGALTMVREFRMADTTTPIVLMGYLNPLLTFGLDAFARAAGQAGADGLIVVDCPPEEAGPLADALDIENLALIRLATPTTDDGRQGSRRGRHSPGGGSGPPGQRPARGGRIWHPHATARGRGRPRRGRGGGGIGSGRRDRRRHRTEP